MVYARLVMLWMVRMMVMSIEEFVRLGSRKMESVRAMLMMEMMMMEISLEPWRVVTILGCTTVKSKTEMGVKSMVRGLAWK